MDDSNKLNQSLVNQNVILTDIMLRSFQSQVEKCHELEKQLAKALDAIEYYQNETMFSDEVESVVRGTDTLPIND